MTPFLQLVLTMLPVILELLKKPNMQAREAAQPYWESVAKAAVKSEDPWAMIAAATVLGTLKFTDEQAAMFAPLIEKANEIAKGGDQ